MKFTHIDTDGLGCLVILKTFLKYVSKDYITCDYKNINIEVNKYLDAIESFTTDDTALVITDICVDEVTAKRIEELKDNFNFLCLVDHHPKNNTHLKQYDWCTLGESSTCGTKMVYQLMRKMGYIADSDTRYDDFVEAVNDWDTFSWKVNGNPKAKEINNICKNTKNSDFINRFCLSPTTEWSKNERNILNDKEMEYNRALLKVKPLYNGRTCYLFVNSFSSEIADHLLTINDDIDVVIMADMVDRSFQYRSRNEENSVFEVAKANGGGGHKQASGSPMPMNDKIYKGIFSILLADGMQDYSSKEAEAV